MRSLNTFGLDNGSYASGPELIAVSRACRESDLSRAPQPAPVSRRDRLDERRMEVDIAEDDVHPISLALQDSLPPRWRNQRCRRIESERDALRLRELAKPMMPAAQQLDGSR